MNENMKIQVSLGLLEALRNQKKINEATYRRVYRVYKNKAKEVA